jgi:hypothetical protein
MLFFEPIKKCRYAVWADCRVFKVQREGLKHEGLIREGVWCESVPSVHVLLHVCSRIVRKDRGTTSANDAAKPRNQKLDTSKCS